VEQNHSPHCENNFWLSRETYRSLATRDFPVVDTETSSMIKKNNFTSAATEVNLSRKCHTNVSGRIRAGNVTELHIPGSARIGIDR
jgi:hypothetical protein